MRAAATALLVALGAALGTAPAVADAASLKDLVDRYGHPTLGAESRDASGMRFSLGHLSLRGESGRVVPVLAGQETVGFFFSGSGTFEYSSSDSVEQIVMAHNVSKATDLKPATTGGSVALTGHVDHALILSAGRPAGELPAAGAEAVAPGSDLAREFADHREKFLRDRGGPAALDFAERALNAPQRSLVRVEMSGGDDLVYVHDMVTRRSETLYALTKTLSHDADLKKYLWPVTLSEQMIERNRRDPLPSRLDLVSVALEVAASAGDSASLKVTETLVPRREPARVLRLSLYNEDYASVNIGAVEPRVCRLKSVTDATGASLPFVHQSDVLLVELPAPQPMDQPIRLTFQIEGNILIRPGGDNYWILGQGPSFPQPEFVGQNYTLGAVVRVKKPYVPFASGRVVSRREEGDDNVVETRMDQPDRFAIVMAGSYQYAEETRDGLTVRVASYAGRNELAIKQLTDLAFGIVKFYEPFLGPFPWSDFTIIEINSYGWGQAPPGAMFITREAFESRLDDLAWLYTSGINERFAHEIAHQYWGHAVNWPNDEEQWLSEAFSEYCAALFVKRAMGKVEFESLVATWRTNAKRASKLSTLPLADRISMPLDPDEAFRMRNFLLYDKGALILRRLHEELGDQVFLTFLKSYQKSFRGRTGTTRDVAGLLKVLTKKDYTSFLESYYWGPQVPD